MANSNSSAKLKKSAVMLARQLFVILLLSCQLLLLSTAAAAATVVGESKTNETSSTALTKSALDKAVSAVDQAQCDVSANCTRQPHQMCLNGRCTCLPNFTWRNGACHRSDCYLNPAVCSDQDPNRQCEALPWFGYSHCVCRDDYIEDPLTLICRPKCVSDLRHMCEQVDSAHSLCNVYRCHCRANYHRNSATGQCEPFVCEHDAQCWSEGDKYRSCVNSTCACTYEEDPITQRCMLKFTSLFKIRYYYSWRTERILLATIFFVPLIFYYCVLSNLRRSKSTVVAFRAPRPGEQFYSNAQPAISIQSPKFMTHGGDNPVEVISTEVKKQKKSPTEKKKTDPKGESKNIKYERFS